jgi:DNA-binding PadR family transcriptional regulator
MSHEATPLSPTDLHVLLVLSQGALYGYAIMKAVEEESGGAVDPEIGSLYRVLARLMGAGLVEESPAPEDAREEHPGRRRKYYALTGEGLTALEAETARLSRVLELARARHLLPEEGRP